MSLKRTLFFSGCLGGLLLPEAALADATVNGFFPTDHVTVGRDRIEGDRAKNSEPVIVPLKPRAAGASSDLRRLPGVEQQPEESIPEAPKSEWDVSPSLGEDFYGRERTAR